MNSPLPEAIRKSLEKVTLDDKYSLDRGRAFMSGVQALVRLPMMQRQRDLAAGLNTSGFISGYRGSPLGGYDQALWAAKKHLEGNHVVFQPRLNEELAATALWGSQQLDLYPQTKKYDGVFGLWYGKGPGVDRCSDVFNFNFTASRRRRPVDAVKRAPLDAHRAAADSACLRHRPTAAAPLGAGGLSATTLGRLCGQHVLASRLPKTHHRSLDAHFLQRV